MTRRLIATLTVAAALATPVLARAQSMPPVPTGPVADPAETAKVRIGPLFLQPEFGLKNVGLDNNVFNDASDPEQDWTGTVSLGILAGLRLGPTRLTVKTNTDYIYYAHFKDERSIDGNTRYQFEVRTPRLRPWIAYEKTKTHERAGFEIDSRAGRTIPTYEAGVEYKVGFRLGTRFIGRQRKVTYQEEEAFRGVTLGDTLDAKASEGAVQLLYEISPISSLRMSAEYGQIRFKTATLRDSEDRAVYLGIEGRQGAGIEGSVDLGYKQRKAESPLAPSFSGIVARGSAAIILLEQVRVAFGLDRDTQWSYEEFYTFYVQSGGSTTVTWRPHQRFDIVGTGRHYWLDYDEGLDERAILRTDKVYGYGGGIGFFVQGYPGTRLGLMVERTARESVIAERGYDNLRYYTQVGFSF
ncbi:MAG: outer membrane beta-barrel protein [Acidobacteriota bacterium]|nr:outer membrane beta-barrel protein [Acidobacteriota bacterium]